MSAPQPPPLPTRPAATVMLVRNGDSGRGPLEVFLMRRHAAMEFAAGVMVFPGGGVDERDRSAEVGWFGPEPAWWAQRFGVEIDLAAALVCAAVRETFEESGVLFAGPADDSRRVVADASVYADARRALTAGELSFADFLRTENLVLHAELLRPWANWVTPEAERTRRYDTYFFVAALPRGQRADGENTESDRAGWLTPEAAIEDFAAGRSFLLPPTWTQLDSLAGRSVEDVLALEREIVVTQPGLARVGDNWQIEFFNSERYNAARGKRWPG
ncbi:NUDIX hydrolase [Mycobacterium sp. pW045]|uniref:NUDIX hydrolase n=1 Tax=Mycobacterium sp. pW045 TaxID=3238984 RepID=UPI00351BDEE5